jgi:hypothetical protein
MIDSLIDFRGFSPRRFFAALSAACSRTKAFDSGTFALSTASSSASSSIRSCSFSQASAVVAHCLTRISSAGLRPAVPPNSSAKLSTSWTNLALRVVRHIETKLAVALAGGV